MLLLSLLLIPLLGIILVSTNTTSLSTPSYVNANAIANLTKKPESFTTNRMAFSPGFSPRLLGLITSIVNLFVSVIVFLLFNFSSNQYQFIQEYHSIGPMASSIDFYLGVDGISIYFVVRPLIDKLSQLFEFFELSECSVLSTSLFSQIKTKKKTCDFEPGQLRLTTGLKLYKPTNSPKKEITRGQKHVSKVSKMDKYIIFRGKVLLTHALIILLSQDYILILKIHDTKYRGRCVEIQKTYLSPPRLIGGKSSIQSAKGKITDSISGTGDPLSLVINTDITMISALKMPCVRVITKGDGVIVVLFPGKTPDGKEGSQETVLINNRASIRKTLHSIQLIKTKTFDYNSKVATHSIINRQGSRYISTLVTQNCKINPWFITGFSDAEGCFMLSVIKAPLLRVGWRIIPSFQIGLHKRDEELLNNIKAYFGGKGSITRSSETSLAFRVFSLEHLEKIIQHFEQYPLQTHKAADFHVFKTVLMYIKSGKHLTTEGLREIINFKASLNNGLTPILKQGFPNYKLVPRLLVNCKPKIPDSQWVSGFTSGEGCFNINITKNVASKTGFIVNLRFQVSQDSRDEILLRSLIQYMGCGRYYSLDGIQRRGDFVVTKLEDILNKIIPFFLDYPILGKKSLDFRYWREAANLMSKKQHLNEQGLHRIRLIKASLNKTPLTRRVVLPSPHPHPTCRK